MKVLRSVLKRTSVNKQHHADQETQQRQVKDKVVENFLAQIIKQRHKFYKSHRALVGSPLKNWKKYSRTATYSSPDKQSKENNKQQSSQEPHGISGGAADIQCLV